MNEEFPTKELVNYMKIWYREDGSLSLDLIDAMVNYLILINVKQDREFRDAIGDGYYK
jgi:hypothetical protein